MWTNRKVNRVPKPLLCSSPIEDSIVGLVTHCFTIPLKIARVIVGVVAYLNLYKNERVSHRRVNRMG